MWKAAPNMMAKAQKKKNAAKPGDKKNESTTSHHSE
jgi:hypothetical protein